MSVDWETFFSQGWILIPQVISHTQADKFRLNVIEPFKISLEFPQSTVRMCAHNNSHMFPPLLHDLYRELHSQNTYMIVGANLELESLHVRYPHVMNKYTTQWPVWGWHLDKHVFSTQNRLTSIAIIHFSDVVSRGGGTAIIKNSHQTMSWVIHSLPDFLSRYVELTNVVLVVLSSIIGWYKTCFGNQNEIIEATANAGDMLLLHPYTIHSRTINYAKEPRYTFRIASHRN